MSGSDIAKVVPPASTAPNTMAARRWRRRQTASAHTITEPSSARSDIVISPRYVIHSSGHDHDVAGSEEEVLRLPVRGDDLVVVAGDALDDRALRAQDHHLRPGGERAEAPGESDGVEDGGAALELVAAGRLHLTDHRDPEAVDLADNDRHLGRGDVLGQPLGQRIFELPR